MYWATGRQCPAKGNHDNPMLVYLIVGKRVGHCPFPSPKAELVARGTLLCPFSLVLLIIKNTPNLLSWDANELLGSLFYRFSAHVIWACWIWGSLHFTLYFFLSYVYHYSYPKMWGHVGLHSHLYTPAQGRVPGIGILALRIISLGLSIVSCSPKTSQHNSVMSQAIPAGSSGGEGLCPLTRIKQRSTPHRPYSAAYAIFPQTKQGFPSHRSQSSPTSSSSSEHVAPPFFGFRTLRSLSTPYHLLSHRRVSSTPLTHSESHPLRYPTVPASLP